MRRTAAVLTIAFAVVDVAGPAQAAGPPTPGGCEKFGQNVAVLGTTLGAKFGEAASGMAKSGPGEFRDNIVKREQADFCP